MKYHEIDLDGIKTYSFSERKSRVSVESASRPYRKGLAFSQFVDCLPDFLAVKDIRAIVKAVAEAFKNKRPVILGIGGHPIKVGLGPVIIDLLKKGVISAIAMNGAGIIHDFELAFAGQTSEDVAEELSDGSFGMARETGQMLNAAINKGVANGYGIGRSVGEHIRSSEFPFKDVSILNACVAADVPITVHVALGTDIIHMHPEANGALIGEGSLRDFRIFASVVADLEGGVYINLGSAVILPEVFLKALSVGRNLGHKIETITTVNMDFIQHYRPQENVLRRPTMVSGQAFALTGHHEIMLPLLAAMIIEEIE